VTRLRAVLGLAACVLLAFALAVTTPDPAQDVRRRWSSAGVQAWAATPDVSARVTSVAVVRTADRGYGEAFESAQALVVTGLDVEVRHRVALLSEVYLEAADGTRYAPRSEFASAGLARTQPGFTRHATLVFEVPPRRLARARLVVDAGPASVDAYADAIRVDLGLRDPVGVSPQTVTPEPSTVTTT
jgi:hypothetical protein